MLSSSLAELLSLGGVIPFLAVINNPDALKSNQYAASIAELFDITESSQLIVYAAALFASATFVAALLRLLNIWVNCRLAASIGLDLSCKVYQVILNQSYTFYARTNSSKLIKAITLQINDVIVGINSGLQIITTSLIAFSLIIGILIIDIHAAIAAAIVLGGAYLCVGLSIRRRLLFNGKKITDASIKQLQSLQEGIGSIRDVILDGNQDYYLRDYRRYDRPQRFLGAINNFLSASPRFIIETVATLFLVSLAVSIVVHRGSQTSVIPLIGAMALGAQRLLPCLQQSYSCWADLKILNASMTSIVNILTLPAPQKSINQGRPLKVNKSIQLKHIFFRYEADSRFIINDLSLAIQPGQCMGLVGITGSGKSTLVDLFMTLLEPSSGQLLVDNFDIFDKNNIDLLNSWRSSIAHVPQSIYLIDGTVSENIAFGIPRDLIDMTRVEAAARIAQISGFIDSLADGYDTIVGEDGFMLSGGQRQRIGIARALYKRSKILILDEATSALDSATEMNVINSIKSQTSDRTVIMIAHRLSTLENCDFVAWLKDGTIYQYGKPNDILPEYNMA